MNETRRIVLMATYYRPRELHNCLDSLVLAGKKSGFDVWIHDNNSDEETCNVIAGYIYYLPGESCVEFAKENIGKARAINKMVMEKKFFESGRERTITYDDIICIADADVCIIDDTLEVLFNYIEENPDEIVVPEQAVNRCHIYRQKDLVDIGKIDEQDYENVSGFYGVRAGQGVAGACMTMKAGLFKELGGFNEDSIYGGNESGLWKKYMSSGRKKYITIAFDKHVLHPQENDIGYKEWKRRCQRDIKLRGYSRRVGYYDTQIRREEMHDRIDVIKKVIADSKAESYLEVGANGVVFEAVECKEKVGVDVRPMNDERVVCKKSSEFFAEMDPNKKFDVIFVDGDHSYQGANEDLQNALMHLADNGTLIVHDVLPPNEAYQSIAYRSGGWCGRVWQAMLNVCARKDCSVKTINIDNGVALVKKIKPKRNCKALVLDHRADVYQWYDYARNHYEWFNVIEDEDFFPVKKIQEEVEKEEK